MAWSKQTFIDPPTLKKPLALFFFIVNIFFPGERDYPQRDNMRSSLLCSWHLVARYGQQSRHA